MAGAGRDGLVQRPRGLFLRCLLPEPVPSAPVARAEERDAALAAGPEFAPEGGLDRFVGIPYTQVLEVLADAITS